MKILSCENKDLHCPGITTLRNCNTDFLFTILLQTTDVDVDVQNCIKIIISESSMRMMTDEAVQFQHSHLQK